MSATLEKILKEVKSLSSQEREEFWQRVAADEASKLDDWEKQVERREARSFANRAEGGHQSRSSEAAQ